MQLQLSLESLYIVYLLQHHGFEAFIVGGAVRDLIRSSQGEPTTKLLDYDFTTNARPEQIQALFTEHFYENTFGTVSVTQEHLRTQMGLPAVLPSSEPPADHRLKPRVIEVLRATKLHSSLTASEEVSMQEASESETVTPSFQITTYRSEEVYDDFRRPTSMTWGTTLNEDLERRDFTINAMALSLPQTFLAPLFTPAEDTTLRPEVVVVGSGTYSLLDPHRGLTDLQAFALKTVGIATERFREDALRMLRTVRFAVQLNMEIEAVTASAVQEQAQLITYISGERIRDEFLKMLASNYPAEAIELLDDLGLLPHILPELELTKGVEQSGHHTTNVWQHSLDALRYCPSSDPIVRLATLLHDIAKPQTQKYTASSITFYNHEVIGARMAKKIAERLRLSKKDTDRIFILVRHHMFYYQPHNTDAAIRRFMRKVGLEAVDDILDVREGDRLGSGARQTSWRLEEMKDRMIEQLHQPLSVHDLAIDGHDLMNELQLQPGPILGTLLQELFEAVLEQPELNTKGTLLSRAKASLLTSSSQ